MEMLKNYEEIKDVLKKLCEKESLEYVEDNLENDDIIFIRTNNKGVFNIGCLLPREAVTA